MDEEPSDFYSKHNTYNILILGEENSLKSSILNTIANNINLFPLSTKITRNDNYRKKFISETIDINDEQYELFDTIGINPLFPINDIETKLSKFKMKVIFQLFNFVIITFPIHNSHHQQQQHTLSFNVFEQIISTFTFSNTKNVFVVFTKGDNIESPIEREETYTTLQEGIKKIVKDGKYSFNYNNILYYDHDNIDVFKRKVMLHCKDENNGQTRVGINDKEDYDDKMLMKLYTPKSDVNDGVYRREREEDGECGLLERVNKWIGGVGFFANPNMVM